MSNFLDHRLPDRFWELCVPEPNTGCWLWPGSGVTGYGRINWKVDGQWRMQMARRVSYEMLVGPIPHGLQIDHLCRTPCCVNPLHLEPVTPAENARRGDVGWASQMKSLLQSHCLRGHQYTPSNTIIKSRGWRNCRECTNAYQRKLKRRRS